MRYNDVREPIEYVVDQYFNRQKIARANNQKANERLGTMNGPIGGNLDESLPDHPVTLIRDETGKVKKIVYGNLEGLLAGGENSYIVWQQELVRNEAGKADSIITTYPDGESIENNLIKDANGKLERYD